MKHKKNLLTDKKKLYYLPNPGAVNKKMVRKRQRQTKRREKDRGGRRGRGELEVKNLKFGCTHRGGGAIGPGSTPPSFVLTPAAFPSVGIIPLTLPFATSSVVEHVWSEVAWVVTFCCSMWLPISFTVAFVVSSVKQSMIHRTIVITTTETAMTSSVSKNSTKNR